MIFNSPRLEKVDYSLSDIKEIIYQTPLNNPGGLKVIDNDTDEGYCSDDEFAEKHEDSPTVWEQHAYERQQAKLRQSFESGKFTWEGQVCLDLSNCSFIKSITIDGNLNYPKSLASINLGGNYLEEVIVRNLPNLRRLITEVEILVDKGNLSEIKKKLTQIKNYALLYSNQEIQERINKLEARLSTQSTIAKK